MLAPRCVLYEFLCASLLLLVLLSLQHQLPLLLLHLLSILPFLHLHLSAQFLLATFVFSLDLDLESQLPPAGILRFVFIKSNSILREFYFCCIY